MCLSPIQMPNIGPVSCRQCWQCKKERVNDLVGRAHAELAASDFSVCLTLTYGNTKSIAMGIICPDDFQKFMKRLRKRGEKDGYTVRYMVAGEYGKLKKRAHFHAILFFKGPASAMPSFEYKTNHWHFEHWDHGTTWADEPHEKSIRYIAKYLLKDGAAPTAKENQFLTGWIATSKVPLLGKGHIEEEADLWAEAGLAPRESYFTVSGNRESRSNRATRYWLKGKGRDIFIERFITRWKELNPARPLPYSELLETHLDAKVAGTPIYLWDQALAHINAKAHPLWNDEIRPDAERVRLDRTGQNVIAKDKIGVYYLRHYDKWSALEKERRIDTWRQLKAAVKGRLPFHDWHNV